MPQNCGRKGDFQVNAIFHIKKIKPRSARPVPRVFQRSALMVLWYSEPYHDDRMIPSCQLADLGLVNNKLRPRLSSILIKVPVEASECSSHCVSFCFVSEDGECTT